jgi:hypothetical protein
MTDYANKIRDNFINRERNETRRFCFHCALFVAMMLCLTILPRVFL